MRCQAPFERSLQYSMMSRHLIPLFIPLKRKALTERPFRFWPPRKQWKRSLATVIGRLEMSRTIPAHRAKHSFRGYRGLRPITCPRRLSAAVGALVMIGVGSLLPVLVAAGAGGLIGAALGRLMQQNHATRVQEQLSRGGLLLWVNVRNPHEEKTALEALRALGAHDVHAHEIAV